MLCPQSSRGLVHGLRARLLESASACTAIAAVVCACACACVAVVLAQDAAQPLGACCSGVLCGGRGGSGLGAGRARDVEGEQRRSVWSGTWDIAMGHGTCMGMEIGNGNEMGDGFAMGEGKVASKRQRWLLASEVPSGSRCIGVVGPVFRSVRLSDYLPPDSRGPEIRNSRGRLAACGRRAGIRNKDKAGFPWPALIILDIMCRLT